jgi:hypothetical protein
MRGSTRWLVAILLLPAGAASAGAQSYPLAPLIARLPGGTRALSMGNADVGGRTSDVLFYNPAQIAQAGGNVASAEFYTGSNLLVTFATAFDFGPGAVGVGVQSLTFTNPNSPYASPDALGTSDAEASSGLVLSTGYAQRLFGFRVGANAKLMQQAIGAARDTRASFDAGVSRDLWRGTLGLVAQNVGPAFRTPVGRAQQPQRTSLGFSSGRYQAGVFDLSAAATASLVRGRDFAAGGGGEVSYSWLEGYAVAVRGGVRDAAPGEGPWTAGVGLSDDRITLDYAYESRAHRQGAHRIEVRIR